MLHVAISINFGKAQQSPSQTCATLPSFKDRLFNEVVSIDILFSALCDRHVFTSTSLVKFARFQGRDEDTLPPHWKPFEIVMS